VAAVGLKRRGVETREMVEGMPEKTTGRVDLLVEAAIEVL
jgi:hypothetical protein